MKRLASIALLLALTLALASSCATSRPRGLLYTDVRTPMNAGKTQEVPPEKVGVAILTTYLGMVASGDCSVKAACANGNITEIHSVDWEATSFLGIVSSYRCVVWGK